VNHKTKVIAFKNLYLLFLNNITRYNLRWTSNHWKCWAETSRWDRCRLRMDISL